MNLGSGENQIGALMLRKVRDVEKEKDKEITEELLAVYQMRMREHRKSAR